MKIIHRYNSEERQHYLPDTQGGGITFKPRLLYSGLVKPRAGWHEVEHTHSFAEILLIAQGTGTICVDGVITPVSAGDLIIYNACVPHYETSSQDNPLKFYFAAFDNLCIADLPPNHLLPANYSIIYPCNAMTDTLLNCFETLIYELTTKQPYYSEVAKNTLGLLLTHTYRLINRYLGGGKNLPPSNPIVNKAEEYIDLHFYDELTLQKIADHCHVSKYHLVHLFRAHKQATVNDCILSKRLSHSRNLLASTNLTVTEIAEHSGFSNLNYFCRCFKKSNNMTPAQYRTHTQSQQ